MIYFKLLCNCQEMFYLIGASASHLLNPEVSYIYGVNTRNRVTCLKRHWHWRKRIIIPILKHLLSIILANIVIRQAALMNRLIIINVHSRFIKAEAIRCNQ